jgi:fatty-acyl-CoA synthase
VTIVDTMGSSESGRQGHQISSRGAGATTGRFEPSANNGVVSADLSRFLVAGEQEVGWLASRGRVPLGYLGDRDKTEKTFPVIEGRRSAVPGDRARLLADGTIEVYGRDSVTINSGGEKIFAEEIEQALKHHPAVYDAIVCGRSSERWGQEVVAIVQPRSGMQVSEEELLSECAKHLSRYKLPKAFVFKDEIVRSPSGKPDYRWAKSVVMPIES